MRPDPCLAGGVLRVLSLRLVGLLGPCHAALHFLLSAVVTVDRASTAATHQPEAGEHAKPPCHLAADLIDSGERGPRSAGQSRIGPGAREGERKRGR